MSSAGYKTIVALLVAAAMAGCAGNGQGLDANGNPVTPGGGGTVPLSADFQALQDNIFTPICSKCHIGGGAPEGLQLDAAHSYALLVGVPSTEQPNVLRVDPGNPDSSYIIRKLMDTPGISGAQMPFGGPYLPQSTINFIRQWITNGAPPPANAAVATAVKATQRFAVAATAPDNDSVVSAMPPQIVVAFSGDIDSNLLSNATVTLESDTDPAGGSMISAPLPVSITQPAGNAAAILIKPLTPLVNGVYQVTLHGSLADTNAAVLGSDYTFSFTVDAPQ
jgi:methionine-rich copper-binding protein CopC